MWVATQELPRCAARPFYVRLNQILERSMETIPAADKITLRQAEEWMIREFPRHYDRYEDGRGGRGDYLEWLALMQHFGAPTRLLDWTFSELVALFLALSPWTVRTPPSNRNARPLTAAVAPC